MVLSIATGTDQTLLLIHHFKLTIEHWNQVEVEHSTLGLGLTFLVTFVMPHITISTSPALVCRFEASASVY